MNARYTCDDSVTDEDAQAAILHYVDNRLYVWAKWMNGYVELVKGYPKQSIECRLMTAGYLPNASFQPRPSPIDEEVEEIEMHIKIMGQQIPMMAEVLKTYYLRRGSLYRKARSLGMSQAQFEKHFRLARWWLAAKLILP